MPKVDPSQQAAVTQAQPYGVAPTNNTKTLQERLMERFAAHEFVMVENIDDETLVWQYLPASSEEFEYTPDPMKITRRGQPELWSLEAGAQEALIGANAYLMIDALYKKLVAKKVLSSGPSVPGQAKNFNYADGGQQEDFISRIVKGKVQPSFNIPATEVPAPEDMTPREIVRKEKATGVTRG